MTAIENHDPGDEDRRPIFATSLELFAFAADRGHSFESLVPLLASELRSWSDEERKARTGASP